MADLTTRSAALARHVHLALRHSGDDWNTYAGRVLELYAARTPLHLRHIEFAQHVAGGNAYDTIRANSQTVRRMVDGTTRMPVEIEEALILALPEPFLGEAQRELAERLGLMAATLPPPCEVPGQAPALDASAVASLMRETADVVQAIATIVADGAITREDLPAIEQALEQSAQLDAALITLREQLTRAHAVAGAPGVVPIRREGRA